MKLKQYYNELTGAYEFPVSEKATISIKKENFEERFGVTGDIEIDELKNISQITKTWKNILDKLPQ